MSNAEPQHTNSTLSARVTWVVIFSFLLWYLLLSSSSFLAKSILESTSTQSGKKFAFKISKQKVKLSHLLFTTKMTSSNTSSQRRILKSLAKTPHSIFEDEDTPMIEKEAISKVTKKSNNNNAPRDRVEQHVKDDIDMDENEYFECGFCNDYHEHWIQCDNSTCPIQWYGLDCAGLTEAPAGKWLCVLCRARPVFPNLPGAPKSVGRDMSQEKVKGVARRTSDVKKAKPGWKGWVELPEEEKEKWQREVDKRWEVTALERRTRRGSEVQGRKGMGRLRRGGKGNAEKSQPVEEQDVERTKTPEDNEEDSESIANEQSHQDPEEALPNQRSPRLSESIIDSNTDEDMHDEEVDVLNGETVHHWDRESTFEGFSDTEMIDDIESGLEELSVVDEEEATEELSSSEGFSDVEEEATGEDVSVEGQRETLGVGADEYRYLDLSPYGPFLVRQT